MSTHQDRSSVRSDPSSTSSAPTHSSSVAEDRDAEPGPTRGSDTLSEVLRVVRLTGAVFFSVEASAPWVAEAPHAAEIGPHIMPGVEHVIEYHVIVAGSCWAGIVDETPVKVARGDVVVFPHGDRHTLSSAPGMRGIADVESFRSVRSAGLPIAIRKDGGGADRASVVCGFLGCDARPFNPLLAALPRMLHVPRGAADEDGAVEHLMRIALSESETRRPGGDTVLARLSELLFVEVVRRYISAMPAENVGWLAGLRDESVGRALGKLHKSPARAWSLEGLAREVGVARSVLAERFAHFVGVPPMQYLARWRMQLAASLLSTSSLSLAEIAEQVGYGSERALSRAYKRCVGVAPMEWKRGKREPSDGE